jgi:hypothetical protein
LFSTCHNTNWRRDSSSVRSVDTQQTSLNKWSTSNRQKKQFEDPVTVNSYSKVVSPGNFREGRSVPLRSVTCHCFSFHLPNITPISEDSNNARSLNTRKSQSYSDCSYILS